MTQPAISQHIQELEAQLGTPLFVRGHRGVRLTPVGETLQSYTERILRLVAEAELAVTQVENLGGGQIMIGATHGVSTYLLPAWMKGFRERYPNLTLSVQTGTTGVIVAEIRAHHFEIGLIEGELDNALANQVQNLILRPITLSVIVGKGHAWCQQASVMPEQLHGHALITRQPHSQTRIWLDAVLAQHRIQPRIVGEFDNPEAIKHAVLSNLGVAIMPDYAYQREADLQILKALPLEGIPLQRELKLVWATDRPLTPLAWAFLHTLSHEYPAIHAILPTLPKLG